MQVNATIIGQGITFSILIWFTMRFVWPNIQSAMQIRENKIADGLDAAQKGNALLEQAKIDVKNQLDIANSRADALLQDAIEQANKIISEAKVEALEQKERLIDGAKTQISSEIAKVKKELQQEVLVLSCDIAKKIMQKEIDDNSHADLLEKLGESDE